MVQHNNICLLTVMKMFILFIMFVMMSFVTYCIISIYISICEWKPFLSDLRDGVMYMQ